jgi:DNA-binding GntR family transcriptional regulator
MSRPGTFERVYAALKAQLREGKFRPGDRLEPAMLSEQLNASVTPVRDALHRLTGERLVEAPRHEGFRVPLLTETTLRHLYAWHRDLLLLAVASRRWRELSSAAEAGLCPTAGDHAERQSALFLAIAHTTGNPEHALALDALSDRLGPLHRLETLLLDAVEEETAEIMNAVERKDARALRAALVRYHRRRERIVPELLERLYAH